MKKLDPVQTIQTSSTDSKLRFNELAHDVEDLNLT